MINEDILNKYQMTIGIECHVQLSTTTKLFSGADNDAREQSPNSVVSPIDFGLPGMLPVLNKQAVNLAVIAGKALNSKIANVSRFDRKHYFYPDLPKGYQTTQMYNPIILAGFVDAPLPTGEYVHVRIHHAHMEEDAGKLTHLNDHSLVDLNRAGTPLIEVVSEPDMHSAAEAKAFATELYRLMTYAGVTYGDLYQGNMRFDVNVSVALKGADELGKRAEVKNLNSFKSVEKAAEYEFKRQVELIEKGGTVVQETRGWEDAKQKTFSQRSKEDAQDYRYMPDADIPPIVLSDEEIQAIQSKMPNLPGYYRDAWKTMGLDSTVENGLLATKEAAILIESLRQNAGDEIARKNAFWFVRILQGEDSDIKDIGLNYNKVPREFFVILAQMVIDGELNSNAADLVFSEMMKTSMNPKEIATEKNLIQVSDEGEISSIVDQVLADATSAQAVSDFKSGNEKVIGFLVGQVMKKSAGKANPAMAQKLIRERIK